MVLVVGSGASAAEQQAASPDVMKQLLQSVQTLTDQVNQLTAQMATVQQELKQLKQQDSSAAQGPMVPVPGSESTPTGPVARREFEELKAQVDQLETVVREQYAGQEKTLKEVQVAIDTLRQQNVSQEELLAAISEYDRDGLAIPNVRAIMKSSDGREALDEAVHQVMKRQGAVVVENRLGQGYTLRVNRSESHYIGPYETKRIPVPVGTITTELVGYESPKNWSVGPPNYEQRIAIGPSPAASPVVLTPAYYWDPLLGWIMVP